MHSRKRSAAFISEDTTNDDDTFSLLGTNAILSTEQDTPSKRQQNAHGEPVPQSKPLKRYNVARLLNNLAFTRLYVTENFPRWHPASSPVVLCCVCEQNDLYRALCEMLPGLYQVAPNMQALAVTSGYLAPNAMPSQGLLRLLPMTTTAGLDGTVAEDFMQFRCDLNPQGCIAVVSAASLCVWTSQGASSFSEIEEGLKGALTTCACAGQDGSDGGDVAMPD